MKKLFVPILMTLLSVYLILMVINMSVNYDKVSETVMFTAVENTATEEVVYVHQVIYMITDIHIEGVHQNIDDVVVSINLVEDGSITFVNNVTGLGDEIEITYLYQVPSSEFTQTFIDIVPLVMIILILGGIAYALFKNH